MGMRGCDAHGRTSRASSQIDLKHVPEVGKRLKSVDLDSVCKNHM